MELTQEKVKNCSNLEELFDIWKKKEKFEGKYYDKDRKEDVSVIVDHSNVFISDGPVDAAIWNTLTDKKILFVLKEAYGESEDWSLSDWLKRTGPLSNIWYRVVEWTYGIINTSAVSVARYSPDKISFDRIDGDPNEWLSKIAVMNLKKSGGVSSSEKGELSVYATCDKEELIREIQLIDPNIIVCGGTAEILNPICGGFIEGDRCDNWYYYSSCIGNKERLFIDYYHPANRYPALLNYYGIVNIYQQALLEKE